MSMTERRTIHKWWWVWDFDKEEEWLNEMAASGWVLDGVSFCTFHFVRSESEPYAIRLQLTGADENLRQLVEDAGGEYVGRCASWSYFRKKLTDGPFELLSDLDSRIAHLDNIGRMLSAICFANLCIGLVNSFSAAHSGWINLLCATLLTYALGRIHGKKEALKKDRMLYE